MESPAPLAGLSFCYNRTMNKTIRFRPPRRRVFRKFPVWLPVLWLFIILGGLGGLILWRKSSQPDWQTYQNDDLGVEFDWPDSFQVVALTSEDKEAGFVFGIGRTKPNAEVFLRYEDGLGPIRFTGKTILGYLVETIDRTYPNRFPNYQKKDQREFVLSGQNAVEIVFTYSGGQGRVRQRYIVVVKEEIGYFLSCQAPESDFFKSEKDFDKIIDSFEFLSH